MSAQTQNHLPGRTRDHNPGQPENSSRKIISPSRLAVWLGVADNSFTKQKTVKFGDSSAVNSGRAYSILTIVVLVAAWIAASAFGWINPIFWPSITATFDRLVMLVTDGFRNVPLWAQVWASLSRVLLGVVFGTLVGVPIGFAMGLTTICRGLFDPIVEFVRPIPPLALIPLVILWLGIGETSKIFLIFLAALFIMIIAARSGVASVKISKVHAAYSLGASKTQVLRHVILPNALPEIFTGLRTAMGICWGTVVAAELVAADKGLGSMIMIAKNFLQTDTVVIGITIIGIIGFLIEILLRVAERVLIPWKGKG